MSLSLSPKPALTRRATASTSSDAAIVTASARRGLGGEEGKVPALSFLFADVAGVGVAVAAGSSGGEGGGCETAVHGAEEQDEAHAGGGTVGH